MPEFGGTGSPSIRYAYLNYTYNPAVQARIGKFKVPVSLEQLQSDYNTLFIERSFVSSLAHGSEQPDLAAFFGPFFVQSLRAASAAPSGSSRPELTRLRVREHALPPGRTLPKIAVTIAASSVCTQLR